VKNIVIVGLLAMLAFTANRLAEVENQRYALLLNMCPGKHGLLPDSRCLATVQTRTSWLWNLYYGLTG
jgi:hypothetical protein